MGIITTREQETSLLAPAQTEAVLQTIIGRAPINLLADPSKAVNKPLLINDFPEGVAKLGYSSNFADYESNQVLAMNFKNFAVAPIIFINVLDPSNSNHVTVVEKASKSIPTSKKINLNDEGILLSTIALSVTDNGTTTTYTADEDYVAAFDDEGKVVITILDTGDLASAAAVDVGYSKLKPSGVTANDIIGGYNSANATYKGIEAVEQVFPLYNKVPSMLLAPGFSKNPTVMAALKAKAADINGVFHADYICDADTTTCLTYDTVNAWKNSNSFTDENGCLVWPKVKFGDNIFHSSIQLGARWASLVAQDGGVPDLYPSNEDAGIQGACLENGTEVNLTLKQANVLESQGICTYLNWQGWKNWGVFTQAYPNNRDLKDYFNAIRVFFNWWGNTFVLTYFNKIGKPMSRRRIDQIVETENKRCASFINNDQIAAARIEFVESENSATDIISGKICFHRYLTVYPAMVTIEDVLEYDVDALMNRLFGGN